MRNALVVVTCALALPLARPDAALAQIGRDPLMSFGVQVNYGNNSGLGVGGRIRHSLQGLFPAAPLSGIASVDIYLLNHVTWLDLNYNVVYNFRPASAPRVTPYAGAGLNFVWVDAGTGSDTRLGINFLGGIEFRSVSTRVTPFAEIRVTAAGGEQLVLTGGIKF